MNLLVTPDQAEVLSLASNQAHIQLVLRNPIDHQISQAPGHGPGEPAWPSHAQGPAPAPVVRRVVPVRSAAAWRRSRFPRPRSSSR